jgi:predicted RNase H-like nuclease (RuvC/YqgF family)
MSCETLDYLVDQLIEISKQAERHSIAARNEAGMRKEITEKLERTLKERDKAQEQLEICREEIKRLESLYHPMGKQQQQTIDETYVGSIDAN